MELQNFIRGRPSQDHKPGHLQYEILSLAGPAKTMSLTKWSSKISSAAGPVKTTNLAICSTKIPSLAGPAKTMNLTEWSSKTSSASRPSQDLKLGNLQYENSVPGRLSKDHEPYNGAPKFHPQQAQSRPQTWQSAVRKFRHKRWN